MGVDPPYYQRDIALIPKLLDFHTGTRTQTHTHIASYGGVVHLKRGYREVCILNYHSLQILRYIQPIGRTCNPPPPNLTRTHMKADGLVHLKILYCPDLYNNFQSNSILPPKVCFHSISPCAWKDAPVLPLTEVVFYRCKLLGAPYG